MIRIFYWFEQYKGILQDVAITIGVVILSFLYNHTPIEILNNAVDYQITYKIRRQVDKYPELLNHVDSFSLNTPLIRAAAYRKIKSMETLLDLGADPNIECRSWTPLHKAINFAKNDYYVFDDDPTATRILLEHGANPNHIYCIPETIPGITYTHNNQSMLMESIRPSIIPHTIDITMLLLDYGADVNLKNKYGFTAAIQALLMRDVDAAYELIVNRKAHIAEPFYFADFTTHEPKLDDPRYPVDLLFDWCFEPGSPEYEMKMEIVKVFEENGIDYQSRKNLSNRFFRHTLEYIKERHPDDWEKYVKIY